MKIIHCADLHLGSKMDSSYSSGSSKIEERRGELRNTFSRIAEYAKDNNIKAILLSGDVFDNDRPAKKDKEYFYSVVESHPDIDFYYLRGNHDINRSYEKTDLPNLKCFGTDWIYYKEKDPENGDEITIAGVEIRDENCMFYASQLKLDDKGKNIVMLHGQIGDKKGPGLIELRELKNKNIDLLALGHIHSYCLEKLDMRGLYSYSGCPEGRGFDETGDKGICILDTDAKGDQRISSEFIPFSFRKIVLSEVDISGVTKLYECEKLVKTRTKEMAKNTDMVRVVLKGSLEFEDERLKEDIRSALESDFYLVSVRDETFRKYDPKDYEKSLSIRGVFIRKVLERKDLSEKRKQRVIACGLAALEGREDEL